MTTFAYDAIGNLIAETNGENETTRTAYDSQGRVVSEWDGNGDETRYRYDSGGNLTKVIDAEQNFTRYAYDGLNREKTETVGTTPNDLTRTTEYDSACHVWQLWDRNGRRRQFFYDGLDRVIREQWVSAWIPSPGVYNLERIITSEYDKLGRVTRQIDFGGNAGSTMVNGQLVSTVVHDDIVETFQYDGLGRLTEETNYNPANLSQGSSLAIPDVRQTYEHEFKYSSAGSWSAKTYRTEFLANGTPIGTTHLTYDRLGRLSDASDFDADATVGIGPAIAWKQLSFSYNLAGDLLNIRHFANYSGGTWQNQFDTTLLYDKARRVQTITHDIDPNGTANDIVHSYGYDNASRVTDFNTTGSGGGNRDYFYDDAGQLTTEVNGGGDFVHDYQYDDNGNRKRIDDHDEFTIGLANRLTNDGTAYTYDNEGNLLRRTPFGAPSSTNPVAVYGYDQRNRLVSVRQYASVANADAGQSSIQSIDYVYDLEGRRVKRVLDPDGATVGQSIQNEFFVYNGNDLALRFGNAGELTHRYQYGPAVDQVLADEVFIAGTGGQRVSDEVLWQLADQQGTVREIVDDTVVLRKHTDYTAFGDTDLWSGPHYYGKNGASISATHAEAVEQLFHFQGQERDDVTGDQKHGGGRWYRPSLGRWLNEDPVFDPNLYPFVGNSPTNRTDPTGQVQAGNPLDGLFGGYRAGPVQAAKPISQALAAGSVPVSTTALLNLPSFQSKNYTSSIPSLTTNVSYVQPSNFALPSFSNPAARTAALPASSLGVVSSSSLPSVSSAASYFTSRPGYFQQLADNSFDWTPKEQQIVSIEKFGGSRSTIGPSIHASTDAIYNSNFSTNFHQLDTAIKSTVWGLGHAVGILGDSVDILVEREPGYQVNLSNGQRVHYLGGGPTESAAHALSEQIVMAALGAAAARPAGIPPTGGRTTPSKTIYQQPSQLQQASSSLTPRNAHLAGQNHPVTGIPFNNKGFPDFSSVAIKTVKIKQRGTIRRTFRQPTKPPD